MKTQTCLTTIGSDRIELLRTYVCIVEVGNLSAAAEFLRVSQPTVSRRLQLLERSLGCKLLVRNNQALIVTDEGRRCLELARQVVASWTIFDTEIRVSASVPEGILRVSVPHAVGQSLLVLDNADPRP